MDKSLELYLTRKKQFDETGGSNVNNERNAVAGLDLERKRVGNNGLMPKAGTDVKGSPGDLIGAAFTLLLYCSETRWDYLQAVAISSAEQAGLILDANKSIIDSAKNTKKVPPPPPLKPFEGKENAVANPPDLPDGVSFKDLCYLIAFSLRCNRKQRLQLLFYLLLGSEKLREILQKHPAGGIPSWIMEHDETWRLSYASLSHDYYFKETIKIDARVAVETIGILLHNAPPQYAKGNMESVQKSSNGNRKRVFSHSDGKYDEAKMHVMLSDYLRSVRRGDDAPVFENAEEQKKRNDSIEIFWDASHDIYTHLQLIHCTSKMGHDSSDSHYWTFDEFITWTDMAIPEDGTLDNILHQAFAIGLLPTPAMERQLVADSWVDWQKKQVNWLGRSVDDDYGGSILAVTNSIRSLLNFPNRDVGMKEESSNEVEEDVRINRNDVWGGIGGFDGRGGLGHGIMYCIDKSWWLQWVAYVGWHWNDGSHEFKERSRARPRELSTEKLLNQSSDSFIRGTMGSYEVMKDGMKKDTDYVLIPPRVWDILYELYAGGPPLPRMVIGRPFHNPPVDIPGRGTSESPKRIPRSLHVVTHPWVIQCQICDPHQPYRRGDLGPMSIRLMAMPNQSLWRLFAEIILRLPVNHPSGHDSEGNGRGRLWVHIEPDKNDSEARYGPWELLMKADSSAAFPVGENIDVEKLSYNDFLRAWDDYTDHATIENVGLKNGSKLMFEYALVGRDGKFTWPREAAAKAGIRQRDTEEDVEFRRMLRGLDGNGNYSEDVKKIVGTVVDAMDSAGRWYQAEIVDTDTHENATKISENSVDDANAIKAVKIDFRDIGGHEEWILVDSDRLAVKGRFTMDSMKTFRLENDLNGSNKQPQTESKSRGMVLKRHSTKEPTSFQLSSSVCSFPGFGACGLTNLGNTCYANSAIQCISYLPLLRSYLVSSLFRKNGDINKENPLGTGGKLLEELAILQKHMWSAKLGVRTPTKFRAQLARALQQYSGADQQDAQELLNDLLDALHEDSNKVVKKPYVEALEDEWVETQPLSNVGEESWKRFLRRNRSIIANIAMGQVLNRVTCPICNYTSHNFDPFNMLSIPFPTVSEVVFKCKVLRRATPNNCPRTLRPKSNKQTQRQSKAPCPPSEQLIMEEYVITMSRLADISDLKGKIHQLCGIPLHRLRLFVLNEPSDENNRESPLGSNCVTTLCAMPEKEGPCLQFARQGLNGGFLSPSEIPTTIMVFETTLNNRKAINQDKFHITHFDASTSTQDAYEYAQRDLKHYGDANECLFFDTDPIQIARATSCIRWPKSPEQIFVGLRVDAIDQRGHWFPGTIIEVIMEDKTILKSNDGDEIQIKVHFDNFSTKWDLTYSFSDFLKGNLCPLYSHSRPKDYPIEFQLFNYADGSSNAPLGYPFLLQFYGEWSEARAGAHILSQASRYMEFSSKGISAAVRDAEMNRIYREYQSTISSTIDSLIKMDREFVTAALSKGVNGTDCNTPNTAEIMKESRKKLHSCLPKLPFKLMIVNAEPGNDNMEELDFAYRLDRSIGNVINPQMQLILKWRPLGNSDPKPLYIEPRIVPFESSMKPSQPKTVDLSEENNKFAHGGMSLGVCLDEFCKEQKLEQADSWKCPKCKDVREGNQCMTLWRLPDLLTFHLKRFNCSARWREKITTKINFPLTGLDMKKWCDKNSPCSSDNYVYDLIGVVNHYGGMTGGHYVATCKVTACSTEGSEEVEHYFNGAGVHAFGTKERVQGAGWKLGRSKDKDSIHTRAALAAAKSVTESSEPLWLQFDDDSVEPIPPCVVNDESAYVLFYRRRQLSPSNVARYSTLD